MPEPPDDSESHVERKVVYETVSSSSSRASGITIGVIVVVALILTIWIITHLR